MDTSLHLMLGLTLICAMGLFMLTGATSKEASLTILVLTILFLYRRSRPREDQDVSKSLKQEAMEYIAELVADGFTAKMLGADGAHQEYKLIGRGEGGMVNVGTFRFEGQTDHKLYILKFLNEGDMSLEGSVVSRSDLDHIKGIKIDAVRLKREKAATARFQEMTRRVGDVKKSPFNRLVTSSVKPEWPAHFLVEGAPGKMLHKIYKDMTMDQKKLMAEELKKCMSWFAENDILQFDWNMGNVFFDIEKNELMRIDVDDNHVIIGMPFIEGSTCDGFMSSLAATMPSIFGQYDPDWKAKVLRVSSSSPNDQSAHIATLDNTLTLFQARFVKFLDKMGEFLNNPDVPADHSPSKADIEAWRTGFLDAQTKLLAWADERKSDRSDRKHVELMKAIMAFMFDDVRDQYAEAIPERLTASDLPDLSDERRAMSQNM